MLFDIRGKQDYKDCLKPLQEFEGHTKSVTSAFLSPLTGGKLATVCYDDLIRIYNVSDLGQVKKPNVIMYHNNHTGRWLTTFKVTILLYQNSAFNVFCGPRV